MKHEHNVNVNLPEEVKRAQDHVRKNRNTYLGVGIGLLIGVVIGRRSTPDTKVLVVVNEQPYSLEVDRR